MPLLLIVALLFATLFFVDFGFGDHAGPGPNYINYSIDARVNITGSPPVILNVLVNSPITLNAGNTTNISCNVSIRDYNGYADVNFTNATLYHYSSSEAGADDNNTHYTNSSCAIMTGQADGYYVNYTCTFPVQYFALNGTWNCTARANDSINLRSVQSNSTSINALYALNVTNILNYGEMNAEEYKNHTANITNLGNLNINISLYGYGRMMSDNLSFVCDVGNLSADVQRFAANSTAGYDVKVKLSNASQRIPGLTINKTANGSLSTNTTWWELYLPIDQVAFGECNGTIVFQAEVADV